MEVYRIGEALLRSSQPLLPVLAPAASRTSRRAPEVMPVARHCRAQRHTWRTSTATHCQQRGLHASTSLSASSRATDDMSSLLDRTRDLNKHAPGAPTRLTPRYSSRTSREQTDASRIMQQQVAEIQGRKQHGFDNLLENLVSKSSSLSAGSHLRKSNYGGSEISSMINPSRQDDSMPPAANLDKEPVKLPKHVGRLVEIDQKKNMDVARAFRTMEIQCARNSVRRDFQKQRFHERPGLKRKRLRRERWAKRFKANFIGTVQMVQRMRKQGW